jgi:hypothetical protein
MAFSRNPVGRWECGVHKGGGGRPPSTVGASIGHDLLTLGDPEWVNELLRLRLVALHGVALTRDLSDCGYDRHGVSSLVRAGQLVRVRAGAFVEGARHRDSDAVTRHLFEARAVTRSLGQSYAVSHLSAVATLGLPVVTSDLGRVHVSQVGQGRSRQDRRLRVHAPVSTSDVTLHGGVLVVSPALAVVQAASCDGLRAGLIAADAALARGLVSAGDLTGALASSGLGGDSARAVEMADGRSESPGESWSRMVFAGLALPAPELQAEIRDGGGRLVGRVDFLFHGKRLIVEFDGKVKYEGADGRDALFREKRREDALRSLGYQVVRLTWRDLHDPASVARLIHEALLRS